jgi:hypothetical protein
MTEHAFDSGADNGLGAPFPPVDPVEDLSKATPAAQEAVPEAIVEQAAPEALEVWENAIGTARMALAEIHALSSSPSTSTTKLGDIAKRALDALSVT